MAKTPDRGKGSEGTMREESISSEYATPEMMDLYTALFLWIESATVRLPSTKEFLRRSL